MRFSHELNRILVLVLAGFVAVALASTYWAVIGPDALLPRDDNPRLVEDAIRLQRGRIYDRHGVLLAESLPDEQGIVTRHYLYPAFSSAIGYFSLRYGSGDAEAAFDTLLSGANRPPDIGRMLLHQPTIGDDVQLTFDLTIQQAIVDAMGGHTGAVVVLAVPSGDVLALVSLPTFDPNTLDANWDQLIQDEGKPFFNRVLQGNYQPGGILQTPLLAAALANNEPLDAPFSDAAAPVTLGNVVLQCVTAPPIPSLTLAEAYAYTCPAPFAEMVNTVGRDTIQTVLNNFQLTHLTTLPGFIVDLNDSTTAPTNPTRQPITDFRATALGQGSLTVSPLQMALVAAAVINTGNAPQPDALLGTRPPDAATWTPAQTVLPSLPFMTNETAQQIKTAMIAAASTGTAQAANRTDVTIGGHAALAYSGEGTQAWFIGFSPSATNGTGFAVAVVIENSADADLAASIGGTALAAAQSSPP